jgi:hemerythrin superfamily protein
MQIYEELKRDHEKIKDVMSRIEETTERAFKKRPELLEEMKSLLLAHAKAEEAVFYRSMLDDEVTHEQALEALEEHKVAESVLQDLEDADPKDEKWYAKFRVLKETLEHHMELEEHHIFRNARKIMSRDEAEEMGEVFREVETELLEELSPH